ncbi:MAG: TetR/AcrR family transcriptional regulator [Anaerolineales bacterium]|jgi:AcrR family transcriptional regulator
MPHDANESTDTRQRLIQAAAELFATLGYARATTRKIAAEAGVSEVTLFRHFGSKKNLFAAVLEEYADTPDMRAALGSQFSGDYPQDMLTLGRHFMRMLIERREAMRMMLCEAGHFEEVSEVLGRMPRGLRDGLAAYLRRQIAEGHVQDMDPEVMAQAFFGMFFSYNVARAIFAGSMTLETSIDEVVQQFVDIFVNGTVRRSQ